MAKKAKQVVIGFLVAAVLLGAIVGVTIWRGAATTQSACESANTVRQVVDNILTRSQDLAQQNQEYTVEEKQVAEEFYTEALEELEPTKC